MNNIINFQEKLLYMNVERQILENQEIILLALSKLQNLRDSEGRKVTNTLIDKYHKTRKLLGKSYIEQGDTDPYDYSKM